MRVTIAGGLAMLLFSHATAAFAAHAIFPKANAMVRRTNAVPVPAWHTVEIHPSSGTPRISIWKKINPLWWFGNVDAPTPPDWFKPEDKHRNFKWHLRNPFHNFAFYVIGIADKPYHRSGRFPKRISNPNGGWNFSIARYKWIVLPFFAYGHGGFDFYLGWRPGGNFGMKVNYNAVRPPKSARPKAQSTGASESSESPDSVP